MRYLLVIILTAISFSSYAEEQQTQNFEFPREWKLEYRDVRILNQDNRFGLQYYANVQFAKWQDLPLPGLPEIIVIGLTRSGELYHLVDHRGRRSMQLLSGTEFIRDFLLTPDGNILAENRYGETLVFNPKDSNKLPVRRIIKKGIVRWALSSLALLGATGLLTPDQIHLQLQMFVTMNLAGSVALAINSVLLGLNEFEHHNQKPSGFKLVRGVPWDREALVEDYQALRAQLGLKNERGFFVTKCSEMFLRPPVPLELSESLDIR